MNAPYRTAETTERDIAQLQQRLAKLEDRTKAPPTPRRPRNPAIAWFGIACLVGLAAGVMLENGYGWVGASLVAIGSLVAVVSMFMAISHDTR